MIDMHIVPCRCLRHARRVLPADHGFHRVTGGLGNLLVMAQAGFLSHADTVDSLSLMAKEIMLRLTEYKQRKAAQNAAAQVTWLASCSCPNQAGVLWC